MACAVWGRCGQESSKGPASEGSRDEREHPLERRGTNAFLQEGYMFLFKLSVSIVEAIKAQILATKQSEVNKLFELMRLDEKVFPDDNMDFFKSILQAAKDCDLKSSDIDAMRATQMKILQEKLEKVREREKELKDDSDDEIVFSDEDEDEEDESERLARLAAQ
ncbi:hypothetical protein GUITHDRAFT_161851 [Guillardia theta CCMP2712]|uniref:Uncharacterized protein n=1 Tax=Guillardia theta (strain CCMP2712) TaxID=905079 RepID=L1JRC3_GUITC|nr:hypothetical protein GUITHDRAFT_161851 [Guillardia theta CCMP2712]EKX50643.1 hypothetical protein GUITHDRAFT_161851 [Guillardia theta CCMP2712]|eukprot:XP_005837623.1 hypothetical protein GUITHDRAFT_161851 [Guillardia theta CCMP2712]